MVNPVIGASLIFICRPIVDATWNTEIAFGLRLTEIYSVAVPCVVLLRLATSRVQDEKIENMPLRRIWLVYVVYMMCFSGILMFESGIRNGLNVFFRYFNGFVGFYMVQAYYGKRDGAKRFLLAVIIAGIFPISMGLYQIYSGVQWRETYSEGIERNIGLYHDAITIRVYAMQTMLATLLYSELYLKGVALKSLALAYGSNALLVMYKAYSKSGMFAFALWFLVWNIFRKKLVTLFVSASVAFVVVAYYNHEIAGEVYRVFHKEIAAIQGGGDLERTFTGRWYIWQEMMSKWNEHGLLGKVFGTGEMALNAHNDYLQMLFHGGMFGLAIYLYLLASITLHLFKEARKDSNPLAIGAVMALIMWLVDSIGLVPSAYPGYQWFFMGLIGLSLKQSEKKIRNR
jgi:O-antigen ligase